MNLYILVTQYTLHYLVSPVIQCNQLIQYNQLIQMNQNNQHQLILYNQLNPHIQFQQILCNLGYLEILNNQLIHYNLNYLEIQHNLQIL